MKDLGKQRKTQKKKQTISEIRELIAEGKWVFNTPKGMPKIYRPDPLEHGYKLTIDDVIEHIEYDDIGYCIFEYIPDTLLDVILTL